ncbi:paired box protein Pax-1-like [Montipora foliosa]|uniref:paired box protein Pax-1-like n=1 Tax=Montipora foliosa TaxID=591990 RepID=UPI0035F1BD12
MFSVKKKGRNYQRGVPLSSDLWNQVVELAQHYPFSEVGRRLRISKGAVSNLVKRYNLTGSMVPKKLNHVRTVPKYTFQESILLETMVQASSSSSLKELRDDLAIHGDCGELSTSTLSRYITNKLPSGRNYSRKRFGKCASERFTLENIVYTQLYIDYLKDKDPSSVKFFDESGFQLPDAGHLNFGFSPVVEDCVKILVYCQPNVELSGWV